MKYGKFEKWMLGKEVTHVVTLSSGVIVDVSYEGEPDFPVKVKYDEGILAGETSWAFLRNLEFLEGKPSDWVSAQEDSQVNWEVGQIVWDVIYGKGEVTRVDESFYYPVQVKFDNGLMETYNFQGKCAENNKRSLFFSEPVVTADLLPPKKKFVPTLKKGDVLVIKWVDTTHLLVVEQETERQVKGTCGLVWDKAPNVHFYKCCEEIKFN